MSTLSDLLDCLEDALTCPTPGRRERAESVEPDIELELADLRLRQCLLRLRQQRRRQAEAALTKQWHRERH